MPEVITPSKKRKSTSKAVISNTFNSFMRERQVKEIRARVERFLREAKTEREFLFLGVVLESWEMDQENKLPANPAGLFMIPKPGANHNEVSGISPSEIQ